MGRRDSRIYAMGVIYQKELETFEESTLGVNSLKIDDEIFGNYLIKKMESDKSFRCIRQA